MGNVTLVLGGVRSGKSAYAEQQVRQAGRPMLYLATGQALDEAMRERIAQHVAQRGAGWETREEALEVASVIADPAYGEHVILLDCLTLWLSNMLYYNKNIDEYMQNLLAALSHSQAQIVLVASEVGLGGVSENALARRFNDAAGVLHQRVAAVADRVVWVVAGIPTIIKQGKTGS